jgi:predicted RNA-binding Zn ribbon-like protein
LASTKALPECAAGELCKWFEEHPDEAATIFSAAIEIREVIHRLLRCGAFGSSATRDDLRRLTSTRRLA